MRALFVVAVLLMFVAAVLAQPDSLWSREYGRAGNAYGTAVMPLANGGYLLSGHIRGGSTWDFWLMRTDETGDSVSSWRCADGLYGGGGDLCAAQDGGFALTGAYYGDMNDDIFLLKMDALGDSVWGHHFALTGGRETYGDAIEQTADGGYIIAGHDQIAYITQRTVLLRTTASGDTIWSRVWPGMSADAFLSVHQMPDHGYILSGQTSVGSAGGEDFWLMKTDSLGHTQWQRTYGGSADDKYAVVQPTADGGYILAGTTASYGAGNEDVWLVKTDSAGNSLWSRTFGGTGNDRCRSIVVLPDGGFVLGVGGADFRIIRTDASGDSLWSRTFLTPDQDWCNDVLLTSDGGYALFGVSSGTPQAMMLIKTGRDPLLSAHSILAFHPSVFRLSNYPNPFNPSTWISFDLPQAGRVSLKVYDMLGREVTTLSEGLVQAGNHQLLFEGKNLASGMYLVRLDACGKTQASRITLLK
jgi:hypothetical protein